MISEIKINNCNNKKNDNNISCIDNSLLIIMKDLSISQNKINEYLCKNNSKYKNLYLKNNIFNQFLILKKLFFQVLECSPKK